MRVGDLKIAARVPRGRSIGGNEAGLTFDPARIHVYADQLSGRQERRDGEDPQPEGLVPGPPGVLLLVAFSAIIPLMTVVNYSVQDTFGNNKFFWTGVGWYQELLDPSTELGGRFFASLWRNLIFSRHHPGDRDSARHHRRAGACRARARASPFCLVLMALPLLIPWNVVGTIWQIFGRVDIGLMGCTLEWRSASTTTTSRDPIDAWFTHHRHGCLALDQPRRAALLCRPGLDPRGLLPGGQDRRRVAPGRCSATSSCRR